MFTVLLSEQINWIELDFGFMLYFEVVEEFSRGVIAGLFWKFFFPFVYDFLVCIFFKYCSKQLL